jgi:hypothetical protein
MNIEIKKFFIFDDKIYSIPKTKWKKFLKSMLMHKLSLMKKKHLPKPEIMSLESVKIVALDMFDLRKIDNDDCVDIIKLEIFKLGEKK